MLEGNWDVDRDLESTHIHIPNANTFKGLDYDSSRELSTYG